MSSERPEGSSPDEPDRDDADTGPLQVPELTQSADGWGPAADIWAGRFDAPLTVNPRQVKTNRRPIILFTIVAVVAALRAGRDGA